MRVLIDTNILLVIISKKSKENWLYQALRSNKISIVLSNEIIQEYEEKLTWFYSFQLSNLIIEELINLPKTEYFEAYFKWRLIEIDPDDNKFVDVYIASNADYIISNDKHFKSLQNIEFPKVNCLGLDEFKILFQDIHKIE